MMILLIKSLIAYM
jgi:hypothetical protein